MKDKKLPLDKTTLNADLVSILNTASSYSFLDICPIFLRDKIIYKELSICETCDTFFKYLPQKKFCAECARKRINASRAASGRKYYEKNKEKVLAQNRKYHQENPEKKNAYALNYRKKNREKLRAKNRKYRKENREKLNAYQRKRYHAKKKLERDKNE